MARNLLKHPEFWTDSGANSPPLSWDGSGYLFFSDSDHMTFTLNAGVVIDVDDYIAWTLGEDVPFSSPDITVQVASADGLKGVSARFDLVSGLALNPFAYVKASELGDLMVLDVDIDHHGRVIPAFPTPVVSSALSIATNYDDGTSPPSVWDGTSYQLVDSSVTGIAATSSATIFACEIFHPDDFGVAGTFWFSNDDTFSHFLPFSSGNAHLHVVQQFGTATHVGFGSFVGSGVDTTYWITPFTGGPVDTDDVALWTNYRNCFET